jgi:D-glycero-D-manno-heptose 1,7-bisphosphate phosphatase
MDFSSTKALFLDRDGVINHDYGYVSQKKDFDFIGGIFHLARSATDKGYLTNSILAC